MSKSKRARSIKPRSISKNRSKAATRKSAAPHHETRASSKQPRVLELLRRPSGVTIATIMETTGWQTRCGVSRGVQKARAPEMATSPNLAEVKAASWMKSRRHRDSVAEERKRVRNEIQAAVHYRASPEALR